MDLQVDNWFLSSSAQECALSASTKQVIRTDLMSRCLHSRRSMARRTHGNVVLDSLVSTSQPLAKTSCATSSTCLG